MFIEDLWKHTKENAEHKKLSKEEFAQKFKQILGDEYKLESDYVGTQNYVFVFHKKCKQLYRVRAAHILYDHVKCRYCINQERSASNRKTFDLIAKQNSYKVIKGYQTNNSKVVVRCPKGHIREVGFQQFKRNPQCVYCQGRKNYTDYCDYANKEIIPFLNKHNVTQKRLAFNSGIDPSNLNSMMRGKKEFSYHDKWLIQKGMELIKKRSYKCNSMLKQ